MRMMAGLRQAYASFGDYMKHLRDREDMAALTSSNESYGLGVAADVEMAELVARRKTSLIFRLAVATYTAYSTGQGFYNTAADDSRTARACLEIVDEFCDTWDVDSLNQKIAMDVWTAGNAFVAPLGTDKELMGLAMIPLSSIKRIRREDDGTPVSYHQVWGATNQNLPPKAVYHFAWMAEDASAWGSGLGQPMARPGLGYRTSTGKVVYRPPHFESQEMVDDVMARMTYAGLPRYSISAPGVQPDVIAKMQAMLNKQDPLQQLITNVEHKVETLSLDTNGKFDSFIRGIGDNAINGVMTPIPRLWSSMNYTYASAEAAIEATLPFVKMYQRAHKRFIENKVYKSLVMQDGKDVRKYSPSLNWGQQDTLTLADIKSVVDILKEPAFAERIDPESVVDMLISAGVPIKKREIQDDVDALGDALGAGDRPVEPEDLSPGEQADIIRLKLMQKMGDKYGI